MDDSYNFYGLNSAVVVVGAGSSVSLNETTLETTSSGSNAVVATGTATATVTACAVSTSYIFNSRNNLAGTYYVAGRVDEAIPKAVEVVRIADVHVQRKQIKLRKQVYFFVA